MVLQYASIDNIAKRLVGRLSVVNISDYIPSGITGTQIGTDVIELIAIEKEEFVDMYLSMIYELPLQHTHPFLNGVVERLIISEVYRTYYPATAEGNDSGDSYAGSLRQEALNDFQCLFNGLGIFVPGAAGDTFTIQNDEMKVQMQNKAVILKGETIKKFIGHDYDGDDVSDTDLFKLNTNAAPSFYMPGDFDAREDGLEVVDNIRVRPRNYRQDREEINFF